jgi:signal peptidase II
LLVFGLILAGATGNLIDSMCYDFFFPLNPCDSFNQLPGSGIKGVCTDYGFNYPVELRHQGFMLGSVVDMFQFNVNWPKWVPAVGGEQIFPAIWNIADASISTGVILILIRQRTYFPKKKESTESEG